MRIKTKYKIGDKLWYIAKGKIQTGEVTEIRVIVGEEQNVIIKYGFAGYHFIDFLEDWVFLSKAELLRSL